MLFRELLNLLKPSPLLPTDERRETIRLSCELNVLMRIDETFCFAKVVDVTLSGLCMELERPLKEGDKVSLARDDFGTPLEVEVLRVPGRVACQIKGLTGEAYTEGEMLDLSLGGALVESVLQFPKNLTIEFETVPIGGPTALERLGQDRLLPSHR